jgi:hypothetical protein
MEQVTGPIADHGEGPVWDASTGHLHWVDMLAGRVLTLDPASGDVASRQVGTVAAALRPRARGGLVLALEWRFALLDADAEQPRTAGQAVGRPDRAVQRRRLRPGRPILLRLDVVRRARHAAGRCAVSARRRPVSRGRPGSRDHLQRDRVDPRRWHLLLHRLAHSSGGRVRRRPGRDAGRAPSGDRDSRHGRRPPGRDVPGHRGRALGRAVGRLGRPPLPARWDGRTRRVRCTGSARASPASRTPLSPVRTRSG